MFRVQTAIRVILVLSMVAACDSSTDDDGSRTLELAFTGLEPLAGGFHYEGWAIIGGAPVSTGKFDLNSTGQVVDLNGTVIGGGSFRTQRDLAGASAIVITIEPTGDTDAIPATTKILAGNLTAGSATLGISAPEALNNSFATAAGRFILATPTDGMNNNELSGVWFLDLVGGNPATGLTLPTLPSGWEYEGWAVINNTPVTTGRFRSANGADESAPFSGTAAPAPPFPGEDFVRNPPTGLTFPTSLRNQMVVISAEPDPDDSPAPFTLKPLRATVSATAADHVVFTLANFATSSPTGTARVR
ncbi:MAG: hypothetical protein WEE89_10210 [Gemmatimonadota bacterium]